MRGSALVRALSARLTVYVGAQQPRAAGTQCRHPEAIDTHDHELSYGAHSHQRKQGYITIPMQVFAGFNATFVLASSEDPGHARQAACADSWKNTLVPEEQKDASKLDSI